MNKYIISHFNHFHNKLNVGLVEADCVSQAIYKAAEIDGWSIDEMDSTTLDEFLRSIEDQYVAVNVVTKSFPAYPGVSS